MEGIPQETLGLNLPPGQVAVISCDEQVFVADRKVLMQSSTLVANILGDLPKTKELPLQNVTGNVLAKVLEFFKKHYKEEPIEGAEIIEKSDSNLKDWDLDFVNVDIAELFELIQAADYLMADPLLHLTTMTVANMIKGKNVDQIYGVFGLTKDDITREDEEQVKIENPWVCD